MQQGSKEAGSAGSSSPTGSSSDMGKAGLLHVCPVQCQMQCSKKALSQGFRLQTISWAQAGDHTSNS